MHQGHQDTNIDENRRNKYIKRLTFIFKSVDAVGEVPAAVLAVGGVIPHKKCGGVMGGRYLGVVDCVHVLEAVQRGRLNASVSHCIQPGKKG